MGLVKKDLIRIKIPDREAHNSRLFVDLCENIHIHYRELRIVFSLNEYFEFAEALSRSTEDVRSYLAQNPDYEEGRYPTTVMVAGGAEQQLKLLENSPKPNRSTYFPNDLAIELQDELVIDEIHVHWRDYRMALNREHFKIIADAFHEARLALNAYERENTYVRSPHRDRLIEDFAKERAKYHSHKAGIMGEALFPVADIKTRYDDGEQTFEPETEAIDLLVDHFRKERRLCPIVLSTEPNGDHHVIDGNHRLVAAKRAGMENISSIVTDLTFEQSALFRRAEALLKQFDRSTGHRYNTSNFNQHFIAYRMSQYYRDHFYRLLAPSDTTDCQAHQISAKQTKEGVLPVCTELLERVPDQPEWLLLSAKVCTLLGRPREAYGAVDRLLNIDRHNVGAWQQLIELLPQADDELAYWIGLKSCWLMRPDVMTAAVHTLIRTGAPPNRIIEILSEPNWKELETRGELWQRLEALCDGKELLTIAGHLCPLGRGVAAETLLRLAIAKEPQTQVFRLKLVNLLLQQARAAEAEPIVTELVRLDPEAPEARLALAKVQFQLRHVKNAVATIKALLSKEPNHARAWFEYGKIAQYSFELPVGTADTAFERCAALAGGDAELLAMVAQYFLSQHRFTEAVRHYENLIAADPNALANPVTCRQYATSLRECKRTADATEVSRTALQRCQVMAASLSGEGHELVRREEAQILAEAGQLPEAERVLADHSSPRRPDKWLL